MEKETPNLTGDMEGMVPTHPLPMNRFNPRSLDHLALWLKKTLRKARRSIVTTR